MLKEFFDLAAKLGFLAVLVLIVLGRIAINDVSLLILIILLGAAVVAGDWDG